MHDTYSKKQLEAHMQEEHSQSTISAYLKEVVYGGIDGIITTFAVVAGFTGVASLEGESAVVIPIIAVLVFGLANLLADGFSMGIGEFLSARSERKLYEKERAKEEKEIIESTDMEIAESELILREKGFTSEQAQQLVSIYKTNPTYWVDFMMRYELEMDEPDESPLKNAMATFFSFIFFGFLPLIPYFIKGFTPTETFTLSAISATLALAILGWLRALVTHENLVRSISEIVFLGALAGSIAFGVGMLFG